MSSTGGARDPDRTYPRPFEKALPEHPTTSDVATLAASLRIRPDVLMEQLDIREHDSQTARPLDTAASARLRRATALADVAVHVLRRPDAAGQWLTTPLLQLGRRTPLEAASTQDGLTSASSVLWRIEYGIFG